MTLVKPLLTSKDQTWATPLRFFNKLHQIFHFRLDPCASPETAKCATYYTKEENGLLQDWSKTGNAFVNPPFGNQLPQWMKKCWKESLKGITVVMLIAARVDTRYWHNYAFKFASCICFMKGRLAFEKYEAEKPQDKGSAPFPHALVVFGHCSRDQRTRLQQFGKVIRVRRRSRT